MLFNKLVPIAVAVGFTLAGCDNGTDSYPTLHISEPFRVIDELSDSTYLQQVKSLLVHDNSIYFCDQKTSRIIRLDSAYNVDLSFGRSGRGPGEFTFLGSISVDNGNIYALDAPQKFNQYDLEGNYIKSFQMSCGNIRSANFMIDHEKFFYSVFDTMPIYVSGFNGNNEPPLMKFGTLTPKSKGITPNLERYKFVKKNDNSFFAVCSFCPLVFEYDYSGNLLSQTDFSDSKYFKTLLKKANESIRKNDGYYSFFDDACINNNDTLYLFASIFKDDEVDNILFVVNIDESKLEMDHYISLENIEMTSYDCFCIKGNELIAFDGISKRICIYDMNQLTENQNETHEK